METPPAIERNLGLRLLALVWVCFLVRGTYYASVLPLWEGYDEFSHFAYVQRLAINHKLPTPDTDTTREVAASLECAPLPWMLHGELRNVPHITLEEFWAAPAEERKQKEECLSSIPPERAGDVAAIGGNLYEAQQPPVYYLLLAPIYGLMENASLPSRVLWLRLTGVLLASLLVPLTYIGGRLVFRREWVAVGSACFLTSLPELFVSVARVSNEALAVVAGALLTIVTLWWSRQERPRSTVLLGTALGAALLVKAYFLSALPAILLLIAGRAVRRRSANYAAKHAAALLAVAGSIAGWWYLRIWRLTGSLTGEQLDARSQGIPLLTRMKAIVDMHWSGTLDMALMSHFWFGGWSFLRLRQAWIYHVLNYLWLLAAIGLIVALVGRRPEFVRRREVGCLAALFGCLTAGLGYHAFVSYVVIGVPATMGWYFYAFASAECLLVLCGWMAWFPERWRLICCPVMTLLLSAVDLYGMNFYLMPYYAGVIRHAQNGSVSALHVDQLRSIGVGQIFARLDVNKAAFLTPHALEVLWLGYLVATGVLIAVSWVVSGLAREVAIRTDSPVINAVAKHHLINRCSLKIRSVFSRGNASAVCPFPVVVTARNIEL